MINPQTLNLDSLPSVSLSNKNLLPKSPGIYFVIDSEKRIQYIGRSGSLHQRWSQHHRIKEFRKQKSMKIVYLKINELSLLPEIEKALIKWFKPRLNGMQTSLISTLSRPQKAEPGKYGETKNRYQFMLTATASDRVDEMAEKLNITRSEVLERLIRTSCFEVKTLSEVVIDL